jgi:vesicle-fusing ATPase
MGKQRTVVYLAGVNYDNNMYIGDTTLEMVRCGVSFQYYLVRSNTAEFIFRTEYSSQLKDKQCSFSMTHQRLLGVVSGDIVTIIPVDAYSYKPITQLSCELCPSAGDEIIEINREQLLKHIKNRFGGLIISERFQLVVKVQEAVIICNVTDFRFDKNLQSSHGHLMGNTHFVCKDHPRIHLKYMERSKPFFKTSINLLDMGIGGMKEEFMTIFRRVFASRLIPNSMMREMNLHHVRGILIYGPPGCGKTLLARQIGRILNCPEPKIVNGPELLNMYVGESEANTRKLFEEAIDDKEGKDLHLIICDEFDALCRTRGRSTYGSPVPDNVVNTLLSYIDGVNQLNNILMVCMTNRIDLIDSAMLRPGRLELQIEITLPDQKGRLEILKIHTNAMRQTGYLGEGINFEDLAVRSKNYTGAEIEGLVKSATSHAIMRQMGENRVLQGKPVVSAEDFVHAFDDIRPMFSDLSKDTTETIKTPLILWCDELRQMVEKIMTTTKMTSLGHSLVILIDGLPYTGKTFLAHHLIGLLKPQYSRVIDPIKLIGKTDVDKCHEIQQVFDHAEQSELSVILLDSFERLIEWCPIGSLLNNQILQVILSLLRKPVGPHNRVIYLMTTYHYRLLQQLEIEKLFDLHFTMPSRIRPEQAELFGTISQVGTEMDVSDILHRTVKKC